MVFWSAIVGVVAAGLEICEEPQMLDVVVVGNGPCGLALVGALTGKVTARYDGRHRVKAYDELLRRVVGKGEPLWKADLKDGINTAEIPFVSTRSANPAALFFDSLSHPFADSTPQYFPPVLTYSPHPTHLTVLSISPTPPGGSWNAMPPSMATLSPGHWMELPGASIAEWARGVPDSGYIAMRPPRSAISKYYQAYPQMVGIQDNVKAGVSVVKAEEIATGGWRLELSDGDVVEAANLVLANGMYDVPKRLGVVGEDLDFVTHRVVGSGDVGTLLVVGAGLSAADCICEYLNRGGKVLHVFKGSALESPLAKFQDSSVAYQEYTRLLEWMQGTGTASYTPYANYTVSSFNPDRTATLSPTVTTPQFTQAAVLIGSLPSFAFFPQHIQDRLAGLTTFVDRKFTLQVDPWDLSVPGIPNLYAAGPIRGDNFVRFITGDSVVITKSILERKIQENEGGGVP
eukprot:TRINITY_DN294_c0_g2_i1.p1 TRINITY_DN294_c0_g2~~TRINITY_DN294_c0_g2_i1.p1  ORF type:complete len:459 (+),score=57.37 TRINITY_DN294_c0_g2_i1:630-2006(+)